MYKQEANELLQTLEDKQLYTMNGIISLYLREQ